MRTVLHFELNKVINTLAFVPTTAPVRALGFLLLIPCVFVASALAQSVPAKPNVIVIVADDLGYGDVSYNRVNPDFLTPNIDSLTMNGVQCTSGYVTHPSWSP